MTGSPIKKFIFITIILLLGNHAAHASLSSFVHVTPETEKNSNIEVEFIPIYEQENKFLVKMNAVGYDYKFAWLIITSDELSIEGQNLRSHIWYAAKPEKQIILKTRLLATGSGNGSSDKNESQYYEVELNYSKIKTAYIYIDFPSIVKDGGYYFSIDLNEYFKHYQSSANKTEDPTGR